MSKKIISAIMSLVLALSLVTVAFADDIFIPSFGGYDRVVIIGVDGAGRFFQDAETPNFDRIFEDGAIKYNANSENATINAENWGSILCGISCEEHNMTYESIAEYERKSSYGNNSVFKYVRDKYSLSELVSFCNWSPINHGIIENDINVKKYSVNDDEKLTGDILGYINGGNAPKLMFVQFDSIDHAAHTYGGQTKEYLDAITTVDTYIGKIYDAMDSKGLISNCLFIVVADHGEALNGEHGGDSQDEKDVTIAVKGRTVVKDYSFESDTRNRDVAAITLYALGINKPEHFSSVVPIGLFSDGNEEIIYEEGLVQMLLKKVQEFFNKILAFFENLFSGN